MAKKSAPKKKKKPGSTFTKVIERGPNKGDTVAFKIAKGGKPFPTKVVNDKGGNSTLKGDVPIGKKKKAKTVKKKK